MWDEFAKTAKIMCLENLVLYGIKKKTPKRFNNQDGVVLYRCTIVWSHTRNFLCYKSHTMHTCSIFAKVNIELFTFRKLCHWQIQTTNEIYWNSTNVQNRDRLALQLEILPENVWVYSGTVCGPYDEVLHSPACTGFYIGQDHSTHSFLSLVR